MTLFLDASALVSLIADEVDAPTLEARLDQDNSRICSAVSAWEAVVAIARNFRIEAPEARTRLTSFLAEIDCSFVAIGEAEFALAVEAHGRYGKNSGHPAALNMGDCFAYACARANNARLLYKGNDFAQTDLA